MSSEQSSMLLPGTRTLNRRTLAPKPAASMACFAAIGFPTHSMTASTPSIPVISRILCFKSSCIGSITASAPELYRHRQKKHLSFIHISFSPVNPYSFATLEQRFINRQELSQRLISMVYSVSRHTFPSKALPSHWQTRKPLLEMHRLNHSAFCPFATASI